MQVVTDDARGDCNMDGVIDAADFPATVLEIFDTDLTIAWWNTHTGAFPGSPKGCDSNGSENGLTGSVPSVNAAILPVPCWSSSAIRVARSAVCKQPTPQNKYHCESGSAN